MMGKEKAFLLKVPITQVFLNASSNEKLLSFTNLPEHITNYNFLLSQKKFMQIIHDGGEIKLHSMEWVHKSSGRGNTELIVDDGKASKSIRIHIGFPLHRIPWFSLDCFRGQIFS